MPLREPADHLYVAQSARAALDVRLEVVRGVVIASMPRALLFELRVEELGAVPHAVSADVLGQLGEQAPGAMQQARLHQRREHRHVAARLRFQRTERADAVPDL